MMALLQSIRNFLYHKGIIDNPDGYDEELYNEVIDDNPCDDNSDYEDDNYEVSDYENEDTQAPYSSESYEDSEPLYCEVVYNPDAESETSHSETHKGPNMVIVVGDRIDTSGLKGFKEISPNASVFISKNS